MKLLLLFFISLPVYSNTFALLDTGARFTLTINSKKLSYSSEVLSKSFDVKKCNESLIKNLNSELIAMLPSTEPESGLTVMVDKTKLLVDPKSEFGKLILMMDPRIQAFALLESKACK